MTGLHVFIGWDSREPIAFSVLAHSILRRASMPVTITPLVQGQLRLAGIYSRGHDERASTEFSLTRFLVPYLCGFEGHAVYMDCDMLVRGDIHDIPSIGSADVWAVQHDYTPKSVTKMDGKTQFAYPLKNWSSLMVFANARCRNLTPAYVNNASPADLHRFRWAADVGALPFEWNWLVGEYPQNSEAKVLHYTLGGPWFDDYRRCDHADEWFAERDHMLSPAQRPRTLADLPKVHDIMIREVGRRG